MAFVAFGKPSPLAIHASLSMIYKAQLLLLASSLVQGCLSFWDLLWGLLSFHVCKSICPLSCSCPVESMCMESLPFLLLTFGLRMVIGPSFPYLFGSSGYLPWLGILDMLEWAVLAFVTLPIPELIAYLVTLVLSLRSLERPRPRSPRPPLPRGLPP